MANSTLHTQPPVTDLTTVSVAILLAILIVVTLGGNAVTFLAILSNRRLRYSPYYLLLSLCVADFMVGLTVLPVSLAYHITHKLTGRWVFGSTACDAFTCANLFFCSASVLNLCAISWDRYVAVTSPLKYLVRMHDRQVFKIISLCWTCALIVSTVLTSFIKISSNHSYNCSINQIRLDVSIPATVLLYIIPIGFLLFVNGRVIQIARSQSRRIQCQELSVTAVDRASGPFHKSRDIRPRVEMSTFRMFLAVTGGFLICWTPIFVVMATDTLVRVPGSAFYIVLLLAYFNSACNPFLYGVFSKEIGKSVLKMIRCRVI